jgi:hypothetical protein
MPCQLVQVLMRMRRCTCLYNRYVPHSSASTHTLNLTYTVMKGRYWLQAVLLRCQTCSTVCGTQHTVLAGPHQQLLLLLLLLLRYDCRPFNLVATNTQLAEPRTPAVAAEQLLLLPLLPPLYHLPATLHMLHSTSKADSYVTGITLSQQCYKDSSTSSVVQLNMLLSASMV